MPCHSLITNKLGQFLIPTEKIKRSDIINALLSFALRTEFICVKHSSKYISIYILKNIYLYI